MDGLVPGGGKANGGNADGDTGDGGHPFFIVCQVECGAQSALASVLDEIAHAEVGIIRVLRVGWLHKK